jgi:hypothetical protein
LLSMNIDLNSFTEELNMTSPILRHLKIITLCAALAATILACGGGGGGAAAPAGTGGGTTPVPTTTPPTNAVTYELRPFEAKIKVGQTLKLDFVECKTSTGAKVCKTRAESSPDLVSANAFDWTANGVKGGNATAGTVAGDFSGATYTAPATKPSANPVAVATTLKDLEGGNPETGSAAGSSLILIANITVDDSAAYSGSVTYGFKYPRASMNATATVSFEEVEDLGNVKSYIASGTINGVVAIKDCDPVNMTVPIETVQRLPNGRWQRFDLVVYQNSNPLGQEYFFSISPEDRNFTTMCTVDGKRVSVPVPSGILISGPPTTGCAAADFSVYTDPNILNSSRSCMLLPMQETQASWNLVKP